MINIKYKSKCSGCSACQQACPKSCITMVADSEGFLYPSVDLKTCINCGKCNKVCQYDNIFQSTEKPSKGYAFVSGQSKVRETSSSGGFFYSVAEKILDEQGVVFGAVFNKEFQTEITYVTDKSKLEPLLRSKYVQAKVGNAYTEAKKFLLEGKKVLFCGTPCQINGLRHFLGKDFDNLLCIDFACHSIPSPLIWEKYLSSLKRHSKVSFVNFKDKTFGWNNYGLTIKGNNESKKDCVFISQGNKNNLFMKGFLQNLYSRPSCSNCISKNFSSRSDITMADFWGVEKYHQDSILNDNKGVSLLIPLTQKGVDLINSVNNNNYLTQVESTEFEINGSHGCLIRSSEPHRFRKLFWKLTQILDVKYSIWICVEPMLFLDKILKKV